MTNLNACHELIICTKCKVLWIKASAKCKNSIVSFVSIFIKEL